jgi:hypothetical protein
MTDFGPKFKKIQKNPNSVEITEYHVLDFFNVFKKLFGKIV